MSAFFGELLIKTSLWLGLAWAIHGVLWKAHPRWRVLLWRLVIAGVAGLPLFVVLLPRVSMPVPAAYIEAVTEVPAAPAGSAPPHGQPAVQVAARSERTTEVPPRVDGGAAAPARSSRPALPQLDVRRILLALYFVPAVLSLTALAGALGRTRRLIERSAPVSDDIRGIFEVVAGDFSLRRAVEIRASTEIASPVLAGWMRPCLLLPPGLLAAGNPQQLRAIFAHEIAHLVAGDMTWSVATRMIRSLWWFHPLLWPVGAAHARACEEVADGISANYIEDVDFYGDILASLALRAHAWHLRAASLPIARAASVPGRLRTLARNARGGRLRRGIIVASAGLALGCVCIWAAVTVHRENKPTADLYGTIVDPEGHPIADAAVGIAYAGPKVGDPVLCPSSYTDCNRIAFTDRRGKFRIPNVERRVTFILSTSAPGFRGSWQFGADADKSPLTLKLRRYAAGGHDGEQVRGRVMDEAGRPVAHALVCPGGRLNEESVAVSGADGRFETRLKKEPAWDLYVQADGYAPRLVHQVPPAPAELAIAMDKGVDFTGRVVEDGRGVKGAAVIMRDNDYEGHILDHELVEKTDAEGRYTFAHVPLSRFYLICVMRESLSPGKGTAPMLIQAPSGSGAIALRDLVVKQGLVVPGRIHLPDGEVFPQVLECS